MYRNSFKPILVVVFSIIVFSSCVDKKLHPNVSEVDVDFKVITFYEELNAIDTLDVLEAVMPLYDKYPEFMKAYCQKIIHVGDQNSSDFSNRLRSFIVYDANKDIIKKSNEVSDGFNDFKLEMENGFKHYKYYFPSVRIPDVYLMISGFSHSIAVDSSWVAMSIEKYLGSNCEFYEWLGIQQYMRKGMTKEKMAPDVLRAIALSNYPKDFENEDVVSNMIYTGKIRYFVHRMFPELNDTLLFDYSDMQMKWCKTNESNMWASLVEWKHLFSDDRMLIKKYTDDAPFTSNFGNNSAPRAGEYLGYKIVEAYLKNNEEVTLQNLMEDNDGRKILAASKYRP